MRAHLTGLVTLASLSCGDANEPTTYNVQVSVYTVGVDQDDLYNVRAGNDPSRPVRDTILLSLPSGEHDVVLGGIASNCSVQGPDSLRVTVTPGDVASATFEIECRALTGVIRVDALVSGRDFDPDGYTVHVDDSLRTRVYASSPGLIEDISSGSHVVTLGDFSSNCGLAGSPTRAVEVNAGGLTRDTVPIVFEGACEAITGDVLLFTTTEGADRDPNGYTLIVDGELVMEPCGWYDYYCEPGAPHRLPPSGYEFFYLVPPGHHTYQLGDIAATCEVLDGESRAVSVTVGDTATVRFHVTCEPI